MAKIPEVFNFGNRENLDIPGLLLILERMYIDLAIAINRKPDVFERTTDGQVSDTILSNGSININLNTNKVEMLTNHVNTTTVTWTKLSP